jgi:hypothetical protein
MYIDYFQNHYPISRQDEEDGMFYEYSNALYYFGRINSEKYDAVIYQLLQFSKKTCNDDIILYMGKMNERYIGIIDFCKGKQNDRKMSQKVFLRDYLPDECLYYFKTK